MLKKLFTRKDKRTNLEREIDSVLDVMSEIKAELRGNNNTNLDDEIDSVLDVLSNMNPETEEYRDVMENLEKLYKAKAGNKTKLQQYSEMTENLEKLCKARDSEKNRKISKETWLIVGASLVELLIMLNYEKANVITSKAFGRLLKVRI